MSPAPHRSSVPVGQQQQEQLSSPGRPTLPSPPPENRLTQKAGAVSFRPPENYTFPVRKFTGETLTRSCKAAWSKEWQWLEYITDGDSIVWGVCRSAIKSKLVSETKSLFLKEKGFSNWRKATEKIRDHEKSHTHLDATQRLAALKTTPINALLSEASAKEQLTARKMLELLFSCIPFLGRQGLPLRGAANQDGVLWQLMTERVRTDTDLSNWLKRRQLDV